MKHYEITTSQFDAADKAEEFYNNTSSNGSIKKFSYPSGVRAVNHIIKSFSNAQPLIVERELEKACKATGLSDYGDMFFRDAMAQAFKDINANTHFHPLGNLLYKQKVHINLTNRLWAQYWLKRDPSILQDLPPSLMITGLQRTGTTFLQRLLGQLPEFRGVHSWEIMNPVPRSRKRAYYGKYQAYIGHKALNYINPEFKRIHEIEYNSLEEEVVLMEHSFMSSIIEAALLAPNYARWLENQEQTKAYQDLKMWLQLLLWRKPAKKYLLLKSPHHMEFMDTFDAVFPNTKVIHLHRDPIKTMASFCSMIYYGKKIFMPSCNPRQIGAHWLRKNQRLVTKCQEYKKNHPDNFIDIAYKEFISDPVAIVRRIYADLNLAWTDNHKAIISSFIKDNSKNKHGKHIYNLADYGLSERIIQENFCTYIEEYKDLLY